MLVVAIVPKKMEASLYFLRGGWWGRGWNDWFSGHCGRLEECSVVCLWVDDGTEPIFDLHMYVPFFWLCALTCIPCPTHKNKPKQTKTNPQCIYQVDNFHTHIISSILHIDHDEEPTSKPWPLFLESFDGNTNEIVLESGDLLFYESSKCLHGRPRPFHGSWYASIFIHYYPADNWNPTTKGYDVQYAIPPHWRSKPTTKMDRTSGTSTAGSDPPNAEWDNNNNNNNNLGTLPKLVMIGTNFAEPECPDEWCDTVNTVRWYGPGKEGVIVPPSSSSSSSSSGTEDRDEASRGSMVDESRHLEL